MDEQTKVTNVTDNPAMQLAVYWFAYGNGKGTKYMAFLPYNDSLEPFLRYLQQLVIKSLGKELDFNRNIVKQGITVLANKGSTDQHSYTQQLRDGVNDFFVAFIEMLTDGHNSTLMVEDKITAGDFLHSFFLGTRQALAEKDLESPTITVTDVSARTVMMLIALFEWAVGFYASLVNINAYHQPGVEAGKKATGQVIEIQRKILPYISSKLGKLFTVSEISEVICIENDIESISKVIQHLAASACRGISKTPSQALLESKYGLS
jgi:glucose-6-phosphate isomerase